MGKRMIMKGRVRPGMTTLDCTYDFMAMDAAHAESVGLIQWKPEHHHGAVEPELDYDLIRKQQIEDRLVAGEPI